MFKGLLADWGLGGNKMADATATQVQAEPLALIFEAEVRKGEGRFSRMVFPNRNEIDGKPEVWPETPQPGSLNCTITKFPDNFAEAAGPGDRIAALDTGIFTPAMEIPRDDIENNVVRPWGPEDNQRKGIAQVWQCAVTNLDTGEEFEALHVRRIDGSYPPFHGVMELMADRKLRDAHDLKDGTRLQIKMFKGPGGR